MSLGWEETWWLVASIIARRSTCTKRQVGCLIVSADNRCHWIGYNGPPARLTEALGAPEGASCAFYCPQGSGDSEGDSEPFCFAIHAEINALIQSPRSGRLGGTAFVTAAPCWKCALALANSGISGLVCKAWEPQRRELADRVTELYQRLKIDLVEVGG